MPAFKGIGLLKAAIFPCARTLYNIEGLGCFCSGFALGGNALRADKMRISHAFAAKKMRGKARKVLKNHKKRGESREIKAKNEIYC